MASKLFGWFAPKRGDRVLEMVEEHLALTQDAVSDLYRLVEASALKKESDSKELFESLSKLEMRADQLRREMVEELTRSEMFPEEREDLMELVRAVDWIADWSKEAGRILIIIPFEKAPEELKTAAQNMCRANVDCVTVLGRCIKALSENPREALNLANEVEILEEEIDELQRVHDRLADTPQHVPRCPRDGGRLVREHRGHSQSRGSKSPLIFSFSRKIRKNRL